MACGDKLADYLRAVNELCADLDITLARLDVLTVSVGRGGAPGLPFSPTASLAGQQLMSTVIYWAQQVALATSSLWDLPNRLTDVSPWLMYRLDYLRAMDGAGDAYAQIKHAVAQARHATDRPMHRTSFPVGPCPEITAAHYCAGTIWAYVPVRIGVDPALMRCRNPECLRHTEPWTTDAWDEAGRRILRRQAIVASRKARDDRCG